jgi:NAD(P)-dependent dehydrogenase (short-subunit alcohol dehydrogenase family)
LDLQLKGRIALVTGSTAGIGFAIVSGLAAEGAAVIINGRSEIGVADAIARIRQKHPQATLEACAGDLCARVIARWQPVKLAAMEGQFKTEIGAPLRIGGRCSSWCAAKI